MIKLKSNRFFQNLEKEYALKNYKKAIEMLTKSVDLY